MKSEYKASECNKMHSSKRANIIIKKILHLYAFLIGIQIIDSLHSYFHREYQISEGQQQ